jgi:hypothetical protein
MVHSGRRYDLNGSPATPRACQDASVGTADLLIAGREAFISQDRAGTVDALGSAGSLPPDASEALAEA